MIRVGSSGAAGDIDTTAGETPKTEESYEGSFGGGESDAPIPRSSNSNSNSSSRSSSSGGGSSSIGSDGSENGSGGGGAAGDCAAKLPKGERIGCRAGKIRWSFCIGREAGTRIVARNLCRVLLRPSWLTR